METIALNSLTDLARRNMVWSQLKANGISNSLLLSQFALLEKEIFLPPALHNLSYVDQELVLNDGRVVLPPLLLARLLQAALAALVAPANAPSPLRQLAEKVLVVGCGTGYSTAILSAFAHQVCGLECDEAFVTQGRAILAERHLVNVSLHLGPLEEGLAALAPFDVMIVEGATSHIPEAYTEQLQEGGRLVALLRSSPTHRLAQAILLQKEGGALQQRRLFEWSASFLPGLAPLKNPEDSFLGRV